MPNTIYATFAGESAAHRAAAALMEYGIPANTLCLILPERIHRASEPSIDIAPTATPALRAADASVPPADIPAPDPVTVNTPHLPGLLDTRMTYENSLTHGYARTVNDALEASAWNDELETSASQPNVRTVAAGDLSEMGLPAEIANRITAQAQAGHAVLSIASAGSDDPEIGQIVRRHGATSLEAF